MTDPSPTRSRRQERPGPLTATIALLALVLTACVSQAPILSTVGIPGRLPDPSCGGVKILIEGALPCDRIVDIAIATLVEMAPDHLARGVTKIDVWLADCPSGGLLPNLDCLDNPFAQSVTVTFGPSVPGGPIEPSLTVVIAPVSGNVLGIQRSAIT